MKLQSISSKTNRLASKMQVKKVSGSLMEMMHRANNTFKDYAELILQIADRPGDQEILNKIEKNRRIARIQQKADLESKIFSDLKSIKNLTQKYLEYPYIHDNDREELRGYAKLLKEKCNLVHVEAARGLKMKTGAYETKLKALSKKQDKNSVELKKTISEIFEKCKAMSSRYAKFFKSSKRGRALIESGCI